MYSMATVRCIVNGLWYSPLFGVWSAVLCTVNCLAVRLEYSQLFGEVRWCIIVCLVYSQLFGALSAV